jgi:hypothetical protein
MSNIRLRYIRGWVDKKTGKPYWRAMFYRLLQRLTDGQIPEDTGDFRLLTRAPARS